MHPAASAPPYDVDALRGAEFPSLAECVFLNAAALGPLPERARRAVELQNLLRSAPHRLRDEHFVEPLRRSRRAAARLIGAEQGEIALGWNTSYGINLAALSLPVERGRCVVVSDREFPANVYPWMAMPGVPLELVATDARGIPDESRLLERLARGDVGVFALSSVQFANGYRADLRRLGEACREHGTWFVVDGIQSLGQVPMDVREAGVHVLASGGHKWLCAPFGTGFAYVRRELHARVQPRLVGWTGMQSCADLEELLDYRWDPRPDARRYEAGTLPIQDFAGFAESVELLLEIGVERIQRHVLSVLEPLVQWIGEHPEVEPASDLEPPRRSGILAFRPPSAGAAYRALQEAGVVCSLREGAIRVAAHLYNTPEEVEQVVAILEREAAGWR